MAISWFSPSRLSIQTGSVCSLVVSGDLLIFNKNIGFILSDLDVPIIAEFETLPSSSLVVWGYSFITMWPQILSWDYGAIDSRFAFAIL